MSIHTKHRKRDGRAIYEVRLRDASGREYARTFPTKKAADAWQAQQRADRSRGLWIDPRLGETTFEEAAEAWLAANPAKRGSSLARDRSALRTHLLPVLGPRPLRSITPRELQGLVNKWAAKQAPRTVRRQYEVLRAILNWAVNAEMLGRSPARGIKLPMMVAARPVRVASAAELAALAAAVGPSYSAMAYLGAVCGLRWGECAGLRVGALNFVDRTVAVVEQRTRGEGGRVIDGPPKSDAGKRTLSVPATLMELLEAHLDRRGIGAAELAADPTQHVFVGRRGWRSTTAISGTGCGCRRARRPGWRGLGSMISGGPTPPSSSSTAWTSRRPRPGWGTRIPD